MLAADDDVTGYPVQVAKVQRPPLRPETLARGRLLDWLAAKIHHRVVLLIAEAGYGKTTLLADFSRRTRVRTLWYRMDETDRGWAAFVAHLVAAGRAHLPDFAPVTHQLLSELGAAGPSRDAVLNTFLRELPSIAPGGAAIIIDDFHLADDSDEVVSAARELLARAPERMTLVIASRRRPALPLARLRALGEVAELTRSDLRFDIAETESLFRDAYRHPLDSETARELAHRTEGWAASLHLVEAAVRGRSATETRTFIRSLSATDGDLYDYLAEEVVGHLAPELQQFLMRVALLETVDPALAEVVAQTDPRQTRVLIAASERFGLLTRAGGARRTFRLHPLVREFLLERLTRELSPDQIRTLHRAVAGAAGPSLWQIACSHLVAAGDQEAAAHLIDDAMAQILAAGESVLAAKYLDLEREGQLKPAAAVILSRIAVTHDDGGGAIEWARRAAALRQDDDRVLGNLMGILVSLGQFDEARRLASQLSAGSPDSLLASIARLTAALIDVSVAGPMEPVLNDALRLADRCRRAGSMRYEGIALLNAAELLRAMGRSEESLRVASAARTALVSVDASEIPTTVSLRAWGLAKAGRLEEARSEVRETRLTASGTAILDLLVEFAWVEAAFGDDQTALSLIEAAEAVADATIGETAEKIALVRTQVALRRGLLDEARVFLGTVRSGESSGTPGRETWRLVLQGHLAVAARATDALGAVRVARDHAIAQGAGSWSAYAGALSALLESPTDFGQGVLAVLARDRSALSCVAELVAPRLPQLDAAALAEVRAEMEMRPERWRACLRQIAEEGEREPRVLAGQLLDRIGTGEDVARLRKLAKTTAFAGANRELGRGLARRLARRVFVEDLGRVQVYLGGELVPSRRIRRKVLALICLLLTRRGFTAPRDEVIDLMWPDMELEDGLNSLNQTIYFLRRVFEPDFVEDLSPGYLHHDSELIWLDMELVDCRSAECARLLASLAKPPSPRDLERISSSYSDRFALDFTYEDWASGYRETLHAAYLGAVEEGIRLDIESGHFDRGIETARHALKVDPSALHIEQSLLRLYRLQGSHAAAGEQYAHYSAALRRELDVEPPPLEAL